MSKIKVLIVDDSAFSRQSIRTLIETSNEFEVVGIARSGEEAVEKVNRIKPDIVTMDVEMQNMSGIEALKNIMRKNPTPVIMVSDYVPQGKRYAVEALQHGAVECFLKGDLLGSSANPKYIKMFFEKLRQSVGANLRIVKPIEIEPLEHLEHPKYVHTPMKNILKAKRKEIEMVFIGCSTGGPNALREVLPKIPSTFNFPILVAQHMPKGFTSSLAKSFDKTCSLPVKEVKNGDKVESGVIYIAPSGYQTTLQRRGHEVFFIVEDNKKHGAPYAPSVDITLDTLVAAYQDRLLSVIMTGMGHDGLEGCRKVKSSGGLILTQTKDSCVVYGMPRSVDEAGLSDEQVDLYSIYSRILFLTNQ